MSTEKRSLKVFLSYASQDQPAVREIYDALKSEDWINPWLDQEKILPGQNWRIVIETAVDEADVVIICLSRQSVTKEGYVQREIKYAYEIALEKPDETIFRIPLRLDDCDIPRELHFLHRVDYFGADKNNAHSDLLEALKARYDQILRTEDDRRARQEREKAESSVVGNIEVEKASQIKVEPTLTKDQKRQETSNTQRARKKRRRKEMNPTIIAALIGGAITLIAALIPLFVNQFSSSPTSSPTMVTVAATSTDVAFITDTVAPNTPTLTPVPATDTPLSTPTGVPPVPLGEDWTEGCISTLWKPYPADEITVTERGDGCWYEPVYVFQAENGDLDVLAQDRNEELKIYGLFARLPESGRVNVTVRLNELTNVDVWLGIFSEQDITSQGLLMTVPTGNVLERVVVQKDPRTNETITSTSLLEQGGEFSFSFTFNANSARGILNPSVFFTESVSIPSSQKWLFLGYKSLIGYYRIEGRFLEFELE